jgi:hypothetical protein
MRGVSAQGVSCSGEWWRGGWREGGSVAQGGGSLVLCVLARGVLAYLPRATLRRHAVRRPRHFLARRRAPLQPR